MSCSRNGRLSGLHERSIAAVHHGTSTCCVVDSEPAAEAAAYLMLDAPMRHLCYDRHTYEPAAEAAAYLMLGANDWPGGKRGARRAGRCRNRRPGHVAGTEHSVCWSISCC